MIHFSLVRPHYCEGPNSALSYIRPGYVVISHTIAPAMVWLQHRTLGLLSGLLAVQHALGVVFGPIATDRPAPAGGSIANDQPPTSFFQGSAAPFPTNDWWVGYGAGNGTA